MSEWIPISEGNEPTGSFICGAVGWVCEGYFDHEHDGWWSANTHWTDAADGQIYPTHYQPMPEPPTQ